MRKTNSEIWETYSKLAEAQGLLYPDEKPAKENAKLKRYVKSPAPRAGSDDVSTIEALYNVKPDNSVKYEHNIMEAAHPKAVVIAPAYDPLNALVENNIERSNVMCNIVMKPNNGDSTQHKYASNSLLMELVRVANDMDNRDEEELRVLADACIDGLKKKAGIWDDIKEKAKDFLGVEKGVGTGAIIGAVVGGIAGAFLGEGVGAIPGARIGAMLGGTAGGIAAAIGKTAPQVKNISENAKDTIEQIEDLKKAVSTNQNEYDFLDQFQKELDKLATLSLSYTDLVVNMHASSPEQAHTITTDLLNQINHIHQLMEQFNEKRTARVYETFVQHNKALTPLYQFIDDDVEDVEKSIDSLNAAIEIFKSSQKAIVGQAKASTNQPDEDDEEEKESFLESLLGKSVPKEKVEEDLMGLKWMKEH